MPKRRLRRTDPDSRDSLGETVVSQMRGMSVGVVESATDATRAALESIRELGRLASSMVVPATRRSARVAREAGQVAIDGATTKTPSARKATKSVTSTARKASTRTRAKATRRRVKRRAA